MDVHNLPAIDQLALQSIPQTAQLELPMVEVSAEERQAVLNYGGEIRVVPMQMDFVSRQLSVLGFTLNSPETTAVLIRHLAVNQLLYCFENTNRTSFALS